MRKIKHIKSFVVLILLFLLCSQKTEAPGDFVNIKDINPNIIVDIKYATPDNFLKEAVYPVNICLLRRTAAERLSRVQQDLEKKDFGLIIYDGYRPLSVQKKMWEILPDPKYVADPATGSRHNRGAAVDVGLLDKNGNEMQMPTLFDDFTEKAARDYKDLPEDLIRNRKILENAMSARGFIPLKSEWWHFDDPDWKMFEVIDVSLTDLKSSNKIP